METKIETGICPKCGSDDLEYGESYEKFITDNETFNPYTCQNCNFDGEEVFSLIFRGHRVLKKGKFVTLNTGYTAVWPT